MPIQKLFKVWKLWRGMIDETALKALQPEDRIIRLKEMVDERKRELQRIDQFIKETITELRKMSARNEDASLLRFEREARSMEDIARFNNPEQLLDDRLVRPHKVQDMLDKERLPADVAAIAEALGPLYAPQQMQKQEDNSMTSYQSFQGYASFKQTGYESLWTQRGSDNSKEDEKKKRDFLFP